jgi:hypothetical protein
MEDKGQDIHPGVALLLARMDSHPEEFEGDRPWGSKYQQFKTHWNATEKHLFSQKMRAIRMQKMHELLMQELTK